jgi:hypothetical protein
MDKNQLSAIEHTLQAWVEGLFTPFLGRRASADAAHNWLFSLNRALQEYMRQHPHAHRLPGRYTLHIPPAWQGSPQVAAVVRALPDVLAQLAAVYAAEPPVGVAVEIAPGAGLAHAALSITGESTPETGDLRSETVAMEPVSGTPAIRPPAGAMLTLGQRQIALDEPLITLGRSLSNHIVLDDPYVSRQHAQMRLRSGRYVLFEHSAGNSIRVNGVRLKEHVLQSGDLVTIGQTTLLYTDAASEPGHTDVLAPVAE